MISRRSSDTARVRQPVRVRRLVWAALAASALLVLQPIYATPEPPQCGSLTFEKFLQLPFRDQIYISLAQPQLAAYALMTTHLLAGCRPQRLTTDFGSGKVEYRWQYDSNGALIREEIERIISKDTVLQNTTRESVRRLEYHSDGRIKRMLINDYSGHGWHVWKFNYDAMLQLKSYALHLFPDGPIPAADTKYPKPIEITQIQSPETAAKPGEQNPAPDESVRIICAPTIQSDDQGRIIAYESCQRENKYRMTYEADLVIELQSKNLLEP